MKNSKLQGTLLLTIASFLWGSTFVAQKMAADIGLGASTFLASRSYVGAAFILVFAVIVKNQKKKLGVDTYPNKLYIKYGIICGVVLYLASFLQQLSLSFTSAGKAGFLTSLYIIIVPVLGIFMRKKVSPIIWICVAVSIVGTFLLSVKEDFSIEFGDSILIGSAFVYSLHIILIGMFAHKTDAILLSLTQFLSCGVLSTIISLITENPDFSLILQAIGPILYAGIFSSGIAYTMQIMGQRNTPPAIASLIMSLESIFAVIVGFFMLGETLSPQELLGCALMFAAVILSQLPIGVKTEEKNNA